jgi:hypothetical protein
MNWQCSNKEDNDGLKHVLSLDGTAPKSRNSRFQKKLIFRWLIQPQKLERPAVPQRCQAEAGECSPTSRPYSYQCQRPLSPAQQTLDYTAANVGVSETLCMRLSACDFDGSFIEPEVVLVIRPICSPVKVDQGFMSGCYSHWFCFACIGLVRVQDAVGRVRSFDVVARQPFSDASLRL